MFGSCYYKGYIYVFGGLTGKNGSYTNTIERYDTFKGEWELIKA